MKELRSAIIEQRMPLDPFVWADVTGCLAIQYRERKASAAIYSLIESAKLSRLKPYEYFNHILTILPEVNIEDEKELEQIMPWSQELPKEVYNDKKS